MLAELIEKSLSGYVYDLALVAHNLYRSKFVCAKLKNRQWYTFDGMRWACTEIGPYHDVSTDMVQIYQGLLDADERLLQEKEREREKELADVSTNGKEHELHIKLLGQDIDSLKKRVAKIEAVISKLKNVNFKESLCKESMYMFYDAEFLGKLDTNRHLICFKNGVLDLRSKEFRPGRKEDYLSLYVDDVYMGDSFQSKMQKFMTFRENIILKRKGSQFRFPESSE